MTCQPSLTLLSAAPSKCTATKEIPEEIEIAEKLGKISSGLSMYGGQVSEYLVIATTLVSFD